MKNTRILSLTPFLLADGLLGIVALLLLRLDYLVNSTFYQYGLIFSTNWAAPYWATIRLSLALMGITIILIPVIGYMLLGQTLVQADRTAVYVCKSCETSWCTVKKISKVNGELPKLSVLESCPSCNEKLLDWAMSKQAAQAATSKRKMASVLSQNLSESQ